MSASGENGQLERNNVGQYFSDTLLEGASVVIDGVEHIVRRTTEIIDSDEDIVECLEEDTMWIVNDGIYPVIETQGIDHAQQGEEIQQESQSIAKQPRKKNLRRKKIIQKVVPTVKQHGRMKKADALCEESDICTIDSSGNAVQIQELKKAVKGVITASGDVTHEARKLSQAQASKDSNQLPSQVAGPQKRKVSFIRKPVKKQQNATGVPVQSDQGQTQHGTKQQDIKRVVARTNNLNEAEDIVLGSDGFVSDHITTIKHVGREISDDTGDIVDIVTSAATDISEATGIPIHRVVSGANNVVETILIQENSDEEEIIVVEGDVQKKQNLAAARAHKQTIDREPKKKVVKQVLPGKQITKDIQEGILVDIAESPVGVQKDIIVAKEVKKTIHQDRKGAKIKNTQSQQGEDAQSAGKRSKKTVVRKMIKKNAQNVVNPDPSSKRHSQNPKITAKNLLVSDVNVAGSKNNSYYVKQVIKQDNIDDFQRKMTEQEMERIDKPVKGTKDLVSMMWDMSSPDLQDQGSSNLIPFAQGLPRSDTKVQAATQGIVSDMLSLSASQESQSQSTPQDVVAVVKTQNIQQDVVQASPKQLGSKTQRIIRKS